jgi:hypothetical protein
MPSAKQIFKRRYLCQNSITYYRIDVPDVFIASIIDFRPITLFCDCLVLED